MSHLYIPHHMQGHHTGTSRWPHFCFPWVLILGGNQEVFNGAVAFEVGLYAILTTDLFICFHIEPVCKWCPGC